LVKAVCKEELRKDTGRILVIREGVENKNKIFDYEYVPRLLYVPVLSATR